VADLEGVRPTQDHSETLGSDDDRRVVARSAAGIYGGAALLGIVEAAIPGGPDVSLTPSLLAPIVVLITLYLGPRVPRGALFVLGPLGAALIGAALAGSDGIGDGAVLYMWPAVWTAYFFGIRGTAFIIGWIGAVHAVALTMMSHGHVDRWIDVTSAVLVVALLVRVLAARNARLLATLAREARLDPLTGLLNRRALDERLGIEISRAIRETAAVTVVTFDVDDFKSINDRHGHEMGDRVLAWLGRVLVEQARGIDLAARIGGDEFVVVLPGSDLRAGLAYAERVRAATETRSAACVPGVDDAVRVSISAGVASDVAPMDAQPLLEAADRALYEAKHAGRNAVFTAPQRLGAHAA
jgi:diguanylate cyclase (GGDEF)-like protein